MRVLRPVPPETMAFLLASLIAGLFLASSMDLSARTLIFVLLVGVSLLGLPHGALDPLIARQSGLWSTPLGFVAFNAIYLAIAAGILALWLLVPALALAAFLFISAWHFAGDWFDRTVPVARLATGTALLCLPTLLHGDGVSGIYSILAGPAGAGLVPVQQYLAGPAVLVSLVLGFIVQKPVKWSAIEILAAFLGALLFPPLVFFLIYFCGLHSPRHLIAHARTLSGVVRPKPLMLYVLGYTAAALALLASGFWGLNATGAAMNEALLRLVFIGLAALTVPHMLVLEYAERRSHG